MTLRHHLVRGWCKHNILHRLAIAVVRGHVVWLYWCKQHHILVAALLVPRPNLLLLSLWLNQQRLLGLLLALCACLVDIVMLMLLLLLLLLRLWMLLMML